MTVGVSKYRLPVDPCLDGTFNIDSSSANDTGRQRLAGVLPGLNESAWDGRKKLPYRLRRFL